MNKKIYSKWITIFLILMFFISCGKDNNKNFIQEDEFVAQESIDNNSNSQINNVIGNDFSTMEKTLKAIDEIENIEKVPASWLLGEWNSCDIRGTSVANYKYIFNKDGTYKSETILFFRKKTKHYVDSGEWRVYKKIGTKRHHIFLSTSYNQLEDYPIEQEGEDGVRFVFKTAQPNSRATLYIRSDRDNSIFPGMNFLTKFSYRERFNPSTQIEYSFSKDGTVEKSIYSVGYRYHEREPNSPKS